MIAPAVDDYIISVVGTPAQWLIVLRERRQPETRGTHTVSSEASEAGSLTVTLEPL